VNRLESARSELLKSGVLSAVSEEVVRRAIAEDLDPEPGQIASADVRVLCPKGHFIANVTVLATDTWPGITLLPPIERTADTPTHGLSVEELRNWTSGQLDELWDSRIGLRCRKTGCQYQGSFHRDTLAIELTRAALAKRPEHRLTT
jgi:hypothetical protein